LGNTLHCIIPLSTSEAVNDVQAQQSNLYRQAKHEQQYPVQPNAT